MRHDSPAVWSGLVAGVLLAHLALLGGWRAHLHLSPSAQRITVQWRAVPLEQLAPAQTPTAPTAPSQRRPRTAPAQPPEPPALASTPASPASPSPAPAPPQAAPQAGRAAGVTATDDPIPPDGSAAPAKPAQTASAATDRAARPPESASSSPPPEANPSGAQSDPPPAPARPPREPAASYALTTLPPSMQLDYAVESSKFPFRLSGQLRWRSAGTRYQAELRYGALGLSRSQTSRGRITPGGLAPERFGDKARSELAAHFNRATGKVTFSANTPDAELLSGAQDRLSVLLQIGGWVASAPERLAPGATLQMQVVSAREADVWLWVFEADEPVELPLGTWPARKLVRLPREPYDQKLEVWLAPQLQYLPVRVRLTEANGEWLDQRLSASQPLADLPPDPTAPAPMPAPGAQ